MKNNFTTLFTFLFCFLFSTNVLIGQCPHPNATICDDMESYTLDLISAQAAHWTPWGLTPGAADDATVSDAQSNSGDQSLLVSEANGDDMLFVTGDKTSGRYKLSWNMYVPTGQTGYFNSQKFGGAPGDEFGMQVEFFADGTATLDAGDSDIVTHNWNHDEWMHIELVIDLDDDWMIYNINGENIYSWPASWETFMTSGTLQFGGINFFGNAGTEQYIDDVVFFELASCTADAVICDDYETYYAGSTTGGQNPWWTTWSGTHGGAEDGIVSTDFAASGANSMLIAEGATQDVLLLLGDRTFGQFNLSWKTYVPANATAYYNIQEEETPGVAWNMELWYNENGAAPGTGNTTLSATTFSYPEDAWFDVQHFIDLDADTMTLWIDGVMVETYPYAGNLGGIDFFSADANNRYYIDDVLYEDLTVYTCDNFSIGTATGEPSVCFGETTSFTTSGVYVPEDAENGFLWIVTSADVSGSMDPFNEASWVGNFGVTTEAYGPALLNDGMQLPAGTYFFTPVTYGSATDTDGTLQGLDFTNGCVETGTSIEVELLPQYDALSGSTSAVEETVPPGMNGEANVTVTGGSGDYTYEWSNGGQTASITGLEGGVYTVTVTDNSGCVDDIIVTVTVGVITGTNDLALSQSIQVYPNPASHFAVVAYEFDETKNLKYSLFNNIGQRVLENQVDNALSGNVRIDLSNLAQGIYFLNITDGESSMIEKLIVE